MVPLHGHHHRRHGVFHRCIWSVLHLDGHQTDRPHLLLPSWRYRSRNHSCRSCMPGSYLRNPCFVFVLLWKWSHVCILQALESFWEWVVGMFILWTCRSQSGAYRSRACRGFLWSAAIWLARRQIGAQARLWNDPPHDDYLLHRFGVFIWKYSKRCYHIFVLLQVILSSSAKQMIYLLSFRF